jgi:Fe2+ transport system protein FeoA
MRRDAPLGDPMEINVMGYNISLRKSEAKFVIIDHVNEIA